MFHWAIFTVLGSLFDRDEQDYGDIHGDVVSSVMFAFGLLIDVTQLINLKLQGG